MRSPAYEQALKAQGVGFTYLERLDLSAIDSAASLRNQARLETPEDEELIAQYQQMFKDGSEAPPLVVYKRKGRAHVWQIIDGNQRLAAAKSAGKKLLDAYQVETVDEMVLNRLTWSFNNVVNGRRLSPKESLEHAKTMVLKYGMEVVAAAKEWGLNRWTVATAVRAESLRKVLTERDAKEVCSLSDSLLEELAPIQKLGDDVFVTAAYCSQRCGLSASDIQAMKNEVNKAKTVDAKIQAIMEFSDSELARQRRAETKGGRTRPTAHAPLPYLGLLRDLKKVERWLEDYEAAALRRSGAEGKEARGVAANVADKLVLLFGLGARPNAKEAKEAKEVG